jgi:D-lyxose ketol-isomerase
MKRQEEAQAKAQAAAALAQTGIILTAEEKEQLEIADFGLGDFPNTGLAIVVYINNDRYCAKELVMLPQQTCPEHRHPNLAEEPGKMETFRCRSGLVYIYTKGEPSVSPQCRPPVGSEAYYTVWREYPLRPGEQLTIPSDTLHWFQAGKAGAIVSEFSSTSRDESDIFTDPRIKRTTLIEDE